MLNRSINASHYLAAWQVIGTVSAAYRGRHTKCAPATRTGGACGLSVLFIWLILAIRRQNWTNQTHVFILGNVEILEIRGFVMFIFSLALSIAPVFVAIATRTLTHVFE
jgi:hypothetical protein